MSKDNVALPVWAILAPIVGILGLTLFSLFVRKGPRPPDAGWNGVFYSNRANPALFVPKRYGVGYTINFGHPWAWPILIFILVMVLLPVILSVTMLPQLPR